MPPITIDSQSLMIAGRRTAIAGAGAEYAAMDPSIRPAVLRSFAALGFNTVMASCPWHLHERLPGGFDFSGRLDVAAFCRDAHEVGLRTILRIGPAVGAPFDGGGIPAWIGDLTEVESRSGVPGFLELVSKWYAELAERLVDLQADRDGGGPLLAIQVEHDWRSGSGSSGPNYLQELVRYARERGFTVPILTSNGFWSPAEGAIETWSGWDGLFSNVRQVATVQPDMPRICVIDRGEEPDAFRRPGQTGSPVDPSDLADRFARVLAAGGQSIVAHAFDGVFPAGATGRDEHGPISPGPFISSLVDNLGRPTERGRVVGRIARFVRDFPSLIASIDPDGQPLVRDLDEDSPGSIVIPRPGGLGDLVMGFRRGEDDRLPLVDRDGRRVPLSFGGHRVSWRIFNADLAGRGRLDVATATPLALVDGRMLLLSAPAGERVEVSIDGRPLEMVAPGGGRASRGKFDPVVEKLGPFTVVLIDEERGDRILDDLGPNGVQAIFVGVSCVRSDGSVEAAGESEPLRITVDGTVTRPEIFEATSPRNRKARSWSSWSEPDPRDPSHPRSIPMDGDLGLASMGAGLDHAWFTATIKVPDSKNRTLRLLGGLAEVQAWIDDESIGRFTDGEIPIRSSKGEHRLALFAGHRPRPVGGVHSPGDGDRPGALVSVKPVTGVTTSVIDHLPMDPYTVASFIPGAAQGELTSSSGTEMAFTHRRKSSVLLEIEPGAAGIVILNGTPITAFGSEGKRIRLSSAEDEHFKAGNNRILILPLEFIAEAGIEPECSLLEVVEEVVPADAWRVRRFEPAPDPRIGVWNGAPAGDSIGPRWMRGVLPLKKARSESTPPDGATVRLDGLTRGRVRVNGVDLGGYALRAPGERITRNSEVPELAIPGSLFAEGGRIELEIFDEGGADPSKVVVRF